MRQTGGTGRELRQRRELSLKAKDSFRQENHGAGGSAGVPRSLAEGRSSALGDPVKLKIKAGEKKLT